MAKHVGIGILIAIVINLGSVLLYGIIPLMAAPTGSWIRTMGIWWGIVLCSAANLAIGCPWSIYDVAKKRYWGIAGVALSLITYPASIALVSWLMQIRQIHESF